MLALTPPTRVRHGNAGRPKRRNAPPPPAPPVPLTLVSARYDPWSWVELTFDRPVDAAGLVGSQILVDDGRFTGVLFEGVGATVLADPATVRVDLLDLGGSAAPDTRLTATAFTGLKAADDGGTWDGVSAIELPFP